MTTTIYVSTNKYNENPEWETTDHWNTEEVTKPRHSKPTPQKNIVNVPPPIGLLEFHRYCDSFAANAVTTPVRFYDTTAVDSIIEAASSGNETEYTDENDDIDDDCDN